MKTIIYYILLTLIHVELFSQDTICFKNKQCAIGRVMEINDDDVTFQIFDNENATFHIINKQDLSFIKFPNNNIDYFKRKNKTYHQSAPINVSSNQTLNFKNQFIINWPLHKFELHKNHIFYEKYDSKHLINKNFLLKIIDLEPDTRKRQRVLNAYSDVKTKKTSEKQVTYLGVVTTIIGAELATMAFVTQSINGNNDLFLPAAGVLFVGISVDIIAYILNLERRKSINNLVKIINE